MPTSLVPRTALLVGMWQETIAADLVLDREWCLNGSHVKHSHSGVVFCCWEISSVLLGPCSSMLYIMCLPCRVRCELSMNHGMDSVPHKISGARCRYSHQYDNKIFLCKVRDITVDSKLSS